MNILLINHYAGAPELGMEFRPYYMAREWIKLGHKVLIIGGNYSHLRRVQPKTISMNIDGVTYSWIRGNKYKGNGIGRIMSIFIFISKLYCNYKKYLGDFHPDVVIASSTYPMDIYPAHKIAKHYGAKLIYEVHDLWPLSPMELGGYSKNHPFIRVVQVAEEYCYRNVDAVVSMLPAAELHMKEHGLDEGKFYFLPNGINISEWDNINENDNPYKVEIQQMHDEGYFVLCYAGGHALSNALDILLDALKLLEEKKIKCIMVGNGQEKKRLMERAIVEGISNVIFLNSVPKNKIPALLQSTDALYIGWKKSPLYQYGISPNKLLDYMMAGKPIIHSVNAANDWVKDAKCGISVEAENPKAIATAIEHLCSFSKDSLKKMGFNGRRYVVENHSYEILSKRFADLMTNLIANENSNSNRGMSSIH